MNTLDGFSHTKAGRLSWRIANGSAPTLFYILCVLLISLALIAQLVEQLICNHQARGSSPRGGTIIKRAWRRDNVPGFHPGVKGLIPLVRTRIRHSSSVVERRSHTPLAGGSNPSCVTIWECEYEKRICRMCDVCARYTFESCGVYR